MFRLFDHYIFRETVPPFILGLLIYTFVLLMNQILLLSEMFIARGVSLGVVLSLLVFLIPSILAFTFPMSILMGILAGLSRMSTDAEVTALQTLGIGYPRLLRPILIFSFCGWILTSFLTLYLAPRANYKWVKTLSESVLAKAQIDIKPREFYEAIPHTVIYLQDIAPDESWKNIFVYFTRPHREPQLILASRGRLNFFPERKRAVLELYDGTIHSYSPAKPEKYSMTVFERLEEELNIENIFPSPSQEKREREKDILELHTDLEALNTRMSKFPEEEMDSPMYKAMQRQKRTYQVEIHKKWALPFACIIFAFLGISLGVTTRKGGRTSGFTLSIAIIIFYYILIQAGASLAIEGRISAFAGIWSANIILSLISIYAFFSAEKELHWQKILRTFRKRLPRQKSRAASLGLPRLSLRFPNILDRYITRKYLAVFSLVFVSTLSLFIIITFFDQIDNLYEHNKPISLFFEYIWYKIPDFVHYVLPISALTSVLLSLGLMTKFNEITAMKASGISLYRTVLPVLFLSGLVSFFSFYLQENILPYSNKKAEETWNRINDIPPRSYNRLDRRWVVGKNQGRIYYDGLRMYYYNYFDPIASVFSHLTILEIDASDWLITRRIYADKGTLNGHELMLNEAWIRGFSGRKPSKFFQMKENSLFINETKDYFIKDWKEPDQMNYAELAQYIQDIKERQFDTVRLQVDLHSKISFPLVSLIMTLLAIPFAFSMGKRGALVGIGLSLIIAMIYWGAIGVFQSMGYAGYLQPFLAAWGPNFLFGLVGLYFMLTLRT
jgi:LPS export ABC transporter permease LptF/LPS export ABC transporter permease LptG